MRIVSVARIRAGSRESARPFKGIFCDDVSEFESYMPSQAVGLHEAFKGSTEVTLTTPANTGPTTAFRPWPSRGEGEYVHADDNPRRGRSASYRFIFCQCVGTCGFSLSAAAGTTPALRSSRRSAAASGPPAPAA